jgi:hypothetical protein
MAASRTIPLAAGLAATLLAAAPAVAQPQLAQYGGYYPPPQAMYYPQPRMYPPSWYYSPFADPFDNGYTLVNPEYPCVWEGRGCPMGR